MTTHATWTGKDASGNWRSLRSDQTLWNYSTLAGWTQDTTGADLTAITWYALVETCAAVALAKGAATAAGESNIPPPPPPPQLP